MNLPVWKTYCKYLIFNHKITSISLSIISFKVYDLQLQAPKPRPILRHKHLTNVPSYYGYEYHGMISRQEAEFLLGSDDGNFLVRESNNPPGSATLAIKY